MSEPQLTFTAFVISLASSAAIHFGDLPDPAGGTTTPNLEGAAQMIEILGLLEQKTRGNLTAEERTLLVQHLFEERPLFRGQVAAGFLLEQAEDLDHLRGALEIGRRRAARGVRQIAEMDRGAARQRDHEGGEGQLRLGHSTKYSKSFHSLSPPPWP